MQSNFYGDVGKDAHICLPKAFSIVLGVDIRDIFTFIGHDGSEIIWPLNKEPYNKRGFHPQEMIDYCWFQHSRPVVMVEASPVQTTIGDNNPPYHTPIKNQVKRIEAYLKDSEGVVCGLFNGSKYHAEAWISNHFHNKLAKLEGLHYYFMMPK